MIKEQYYRILDNALSNAKRNDFTPNEFHCMLDGIILCALNDYGITPEDYLEIIVYNDKIAEEIGK